MLHRVLTSPIGAMVLALLLVALGAVAAACGPSSSATTATPATATPATTSATATSATGAKELTVSAASSLKAAFTEIGKGFDAANGSKTTFNFDASGTLQKQIEGGAPVDVFASAAMKQAKALQDGGLVDAASVKLFAGNAIVLAVPADSTLNLTSFEDLTRTDVKKITYGDPKAAPHGVAAEEILSKLGIFDQVKPKVVYATNVSQALQYVSTGEVEAAIIFATEAKAGGDRVKVIATADQAWYTKVAYPVALVTASEVKGLGQAFIDYVAGPEGQTVLAKHGFLPAL